MEFFLLSFRIAIGPVRDRLYQAGMMEEIGKENQFMYLQDAIEYHLARKSMKAYNWVEDAIQTNYDNEN